MNILKITILLIVLLLLNGFIFKNQTKDPAEILQSFKPRGILLNQFLKKCQENNISLLLVTDKMGNKSKKTRFTTYKSTLLYLSKKGQKKLTYLFNFKDDTLMAVKSY